MNLILKFDQYLGDVVLLLSIVSILNREFGEQ